MRAAGTSSNVPRSVRSRMMKSPASTPRAVRTCSGRVARPFLSSVTNAELIETPSGPSSPQWDYTTLVEPDADELRHSRLFLRDAGEGLRGLHRPLIVRDEDELRLLGQLHEERREAVDVRLVERGVDFVEDAERRRLVLEDRDEERDGRERLLAAREEADRLVPLARGLRHDLETRVERIALVQQMHRGRAAVEEALEHLAEVEVHGGERLLKALRRREVDRLDRLENLGERRLEVGLLSRQLLEPLALDLVFFECGVVDGAEPLERERARRHVFGQGGFEVFLFHLPLGLAALEDGQLARQAAELVPALLHEVILIGLATFEAELGLEPRPPRGVESVARGGGPRLGGHARLAP